MEVIGIVALIIIEIAAATGACYAIKKLRDYQIQKELDNDIF